MTRLDTAEMSDTHPLAVFTTRSPEETAAIGARIAPVLRKGDVVALDGGLGSGKTVFARGVIRALTGASQAIPSPTFTLVQIYETPGFDLWHCDLYRLDGPEATIELGLEEGIASGVVLVEWPDRLGGLLPGTRLRVVFEFGGDEPSRRLTLDGDDCWRARLAEYLDTDA